MAMSFEKFTAKLEDNGYKSAGSAMRAIGKTLFSAKEKKVARLAVDQHFTQPVAKKKRKTSKQVAALAKHKNRVGGFLVSFANVASDKKLRNVFMDFIGQAVEDGRTAPELLAALKAVG